jgi:integrase
MASIRKNKSGTYTATVYVGRDESGKQLRQYITRQTWHECREAAIELESEIVSRTLTNMAGYRVSDYMDKWLEANRGMMAPSTYQTYRIYVNKHFRPFFKRLRVRDVTEMHIKQYITEKQKTLASIYVRKHFFTLSKMFRDALKHKSPCAGIRAPAIDEYKPRVPSEKEFEKIHEAFKEVGLEEEIIVLLAGWCGLRRGEIFGLRLDDPDFRSGKIKIDEAVAIQAESSRFAHKKPKSANSIREVAAPDYLMGLLWEQKKRRLQNLVGFKGEDIESLPLLTLNPYTFSKIYRETIKAAKLPRIRLHDLRHYHASLLYKHNVPDHYAADRLGHDIWVLKKIYQHLGLEEKEELDEKVRGLFS